MSEESELIGEGPITKSMLEDHLQKYFKTDAKIVSQESTVISKGLGFTSDISRVLLKWSINDDKLPEKVILKAPKIENMDKLMNTLTQSSELSAAAVAAVPMIHKSECTVYSMLMDHDIVPIPKIYGFTLITESHPGMIVMEDVGDHGGMIGNIADGLSLGQWTAMVDMLADLHAWSLTTDEPWRDKVNGIESMLELLKTMIANAAMGLKITKEKYPDYLGHINEDLVIKAISVEAMQEKLVEYLKVMPQVMTHGDMWINNIFFEKNEDGTLSDKIYAVIDWQGCIRNFGVYDFTRFEGWCLNHEVRRKHANEMLRRYYDRLKSKVADGVLTATFEQLQEMYQATSALNSMFGVVAADMFLTMIAKVDEDPTGFRKKEMLERLKAGYDEAERFYLAQEVEKTRL